MTELPEGSEPVFLSSKTQQIYHCVCDEDVTKASPFKIITKEEILEDMHNRAAICDFHPLKQRIIVSGHTTLNVFLPAIAQAFKRPHYFRKKL